MAGPSGGASGPLNNLAATRLPTVNDDALSGYASGSRWLSLGTGDMLTCRDGTPGAARWVKVDVADHPGYVAGRAYLPFGHGATANGIAGAANTIYMAYGVLKQRVPLPALGSRLTTASAGGGFQLAVYAHNPAMAGPGLFIGATGTQSTANAGLFNVPVSGGAPLPDPGAYWWCSNQDNAVAVFQALGLASPAHVSINGDSSGAAIPAGTSNGSQVTGYSTPQAFGTWPADLSNATLAPATVGRNPMIQFIVGS